MVQVVGDRYRLDAELGSGGTATVWLAQDLVLDRLVAVKLLSPVQGSAAAARRSRMRVEARALARLDHPGVVKIFDLGTHDDDRDYLVMEYVAGGSLYDRLAATGPMAPAAAVDVAVAVLTALQAAHEEGIVHRDVKPGNVLVRDDGSVALCDFGIARQQGSGTQTGVLLGSLGYMAPEQRVDPRNVGPGADLYGVGCTLFHAVTCDTPVDLYLAADLSPRFASVPRPLLDVVRRATAADPGARYGSAAEMIGALTTVRDVVAAVPAARRRSTTGDHPATRVPTGAHVDPGATPILRQVQPQDYAWSARPPRAGRMALWVGIAAIGLTGVTGWLAPRWLAQRSAGAEGTRTDGAVGSDPDASVQPGGEPQGVWIGTFDGNRAVLDLHGSNDALEGEVLLMLGAHERKTTVRGSYDPGTRTLVLQDASTAPGAGAYEATLEPDGLVLRGRFVSAAGGAVLPFALVALD